MATERYDDKTAAVARVYAAALLALAEEDGRADEVRDELTALEELVERSPAFHDFLVSPAIGADERSASLEKALRGRASDLVADAVQVMNRKGRSGLLPAVAATYREAHDVLRQRVEVRVTSALPLTAAQRERLAAAVEAATGRQPSLEERVDPAILGGLVVQLGDRKADASLATRLKNLSAALLARASRQLRSGSHVEGMVA
jgi:F-type H+-transporting ATPase subunit delta